jgi:hypothetical protein
MYKCPTSDDPDDQDYLPSEDDSEEDSESYDGGREVYWDNSKNHQDILKRWLNFEMDNVNNFNSNSIFSTVHFKIEDTERIFLLDQRKIILRKFSGKLHP